MNMNTILLVEDQLSHREMIADLLQHRGFHVIFADDGVEALEKFQTQRPDLVILDIVMPRMNGYEVCRQLKNDPKTKDIPILMCSGKGEEFDRFWGLKNGADAYIHKPFKPTEFIDTIQQLLRG
jgi:twitching motility two-component system response regulator PilH